ncbi:MAG TPA: T9SS type A sorting domain-containing protein, partial [Ignavibacteria bacterium]|nr:T9SS type A sorting domain-containing protein [Ignavibacteria bacterium]
LDYHQSTNMVRVATHGRGVWEIGIPIGIVNYNNEIPKEYTLKQNFPNPFNPVTFIEYSIVEGGYAELTVYDILGREVETIIKAEQKPGTYKVQFNAARLSSGIYFYTLRADGFTETKKMVVTK